MAIAIKLHVTLKNWIGQIKAYFKQKQNILLYKMVTILLFVDCAVAVRSGFVNMADTKVVVSGRS
jgi:hypothetical protein